MNAVKRVGGGSQHWPRGGRCARNNRRRRRCLDTPGRCLLVNHATSKARPMRDIGNSLEASSKQASPWRALKRELLEEIGLDIGAVGGGERRSWIIPMRWFDCTFAKVYAWSGCWRCVRDNATTGHTCQSHVEPDATGSLAGFEMAGGARFGWLAMENIANYSRILQGQPTFLLDQSWVTLKTDLHRSSRDLPTRKLSLAQSKINSLATCAAERAVGILEKTEQTARRLGPEPYVGTADVSMPWSACVGHKG